jgi:hypothetical protein
MGFHLPLRSRPRRLTVPVAEDRQVLAADWADAALTLELAQARYRAALSAVAPAGTLAEATAELMRARARLEALRRNAAPRELLRAG